MMDEGKHPKLNGSDGSLYDVYIPMGMTAENAAERCKVTRRQQDEWAVISQNRAVDARDSGHFDARIMTTLINGLTTLDGHFGIESMCLAGGMGRAMLIERLN